MASGTLERPDLYLFLVEEIVEEDITIASSGYVVQEIDVAKSGYTPIGVVGFAVMTGTTSGTGVSYVSCRSARLVENSKAQVSCRNHNSGSAAKVNIAVNVLYSKNL